MKMSPKLLIIIVVVVLLLLASAGICGYFIFDKFFSEETQESSSDTGVTDSSDTEDISADEQEDNIVKSGSKKLIFIHHSTGENWLADDYGELGEALAEEGYFVSDTNYGWPSTGSGQGVQTIGDYTDIGHWWLWFRGPDSEEYLKALYEEDEQNSDYSRLSTDPGGENEIIMFKSCFPNSALQGSSNDGIPDIDDNMLKGEDAYSSYHTVANAKGIYIDLLEYFKTEQDKLFIVVTAPPLSDPTYASNAKAFNEWLVNDWLENYEYDNVTVFDFFSILSDEDGVLKYPSSDGDGHPSAEGSQIATEEFILFLNDIYKIWKD
jgi:hypothetical protein